MDEYISREAVVRYLKGYSEKELNHNGHFGMITSSVLDRAERAISEMPAADVQPVNHWISVKDRLPEMDVNVLVYTELKNTFVTSRVDAETWEDDYGFFLAEGVTHWRPLPNPPENEE